MLKNLPKLLSVNIQLKKHTFESLSIAFRALSISYWDLQDKNNECLEVLKKAKTTLLASKVMNEKLLALNAELLIRLQKAEMQLKEIDK